MEVEFVQEFRRRLWVLSYVPMQDNVFLVFGIISSAYKQLCKCYGLITVGRLSTGSGHFES